MVGFRPGSEERDDPNLYAVTGGFRVLRCRETTRVQRFDDQHYPLSYIFRDALILLTPTVLMLLGVLILG